MAAGVLRRAAPVVTSIGTLYLRRMIIAADNLRRSMSHLPGHHEKEEGSPEN